MKNDYVPRRFYLKRSVPFPVFKHLNNYAIESQVGEGTYGFFILTLVKSLKLKVPQETL